MRNKSEDMDSRYFCGDCKKIIDKPIWVNVNERLESGLCPNCKSEVSKRLRDELLASIYNNICS